MTGKTLRLRRLATDGRYVLIPMDHGVSDGPVAGLQDIRRTFQAVAAGGATGVVTHKGLVRAFADADAPTGLLVHLSASTADGPDPHDKRLVGTVDEVLALGADGVSVHINVGAATEADQLEDLGLVAEAAHATGLPLLAMMYPRGPKVKDPYAPQRVAHAARLGEELGADLVKTLYTGDVASFRDVVASLTIPVLVAGGQRMEDTGQVLSLVADAMKAGAAGVSIGRNVFQHPDPGAMTAALGRIVIDGASPDEAAKALTKKVRA